MTPEEIAAKEAADAAAAAPDPNAQILEALGNLDSRFGEIEGKLNDFETKLTPPASPVEDKKPEGWVPNTWDDVPAVAEEKAREVFHAELNKMQDEQRRATEQEQATLASLNASFDQQIDTLEKNEVLPKVVDPSNPNDPGKIARREVYAYAVKMDTTNLISAAESLKVIHQTGMTFDPGTSTFIKSNVTPPGANAPVGSSSATTGASAGGPSYEQIHGRSMDDLIRLAGMS